MEAFRRKAREQLQQQVDAAGGDATLVTKLFLSNCALPGDDSLSATRFPNLTSLSLECMKPALASLEPLRQFTGLKSLAINSNRVSAAPGDGFSLPKVTRVSAANNKFATLDDVATLAVAFPALEILDLSMNAVEDTGDFRAKAFAALPQLMVLDDADKDGEEVEVADSDEDSDSDDEEGEDEEEESEIDTDSGDGDSDSGEEAEADATANAGADANATAAAPAASPARQQSAEAEPPLKQHRTEE